MRHALHGNLLVFHYHEEGEELHLKLHVVAIAKSFHIETTFFARARIVSDMWLQ
jgi:hypothetical protein